MRVLLADDDAHVLSALRLLLEHEPGVAIVGECASADTLLEQVASTASTVVLLDWDLPRLRVSDAVQRLRLAQPGCQLLVLSGRPEHRAEALCAGAAAFVCKGDAPEALLTALQRLTTDQPAAPSDGEVDGRQSGGADHRPA